MPSSLEHLVQEAKAGDRQALEKIVAQIQAPVFRMAFRMLGFPEDAEDAAQEILIKVITHLADFRGESAFRTWVYRLACNHLLNTRKRRMERLGINFELWESLIQTELADPRVDSLPEAEQALLVQEVRIGCMQGLMLSLDRNHRMAVILGQIFEVSSREGAFILDISPETFRKRLSRGRQRIQAFLRKHCGLVRDRGPCSCRQQVARDLATGWVKPGKLHFAGQFPLPEEQERVLQGLRELTSVARITCLMRDYPAYRPPAAFGRLVRDLIDTGRFGLLNG